MVGHTWSTTTIVPVMAAAYWTALDVLLFDSPANDSKDGTSEPKIPLTFTSDIWSLGITILEVDCICIMFTDVY